MLQTLMTMALLLSSLASAAAPAPSPAPAADFEAISREYEDAEAAFREQLRARYAEADAAGRRLYIPFAETPPARFAPRFLAFAEANPGHPSAFDAIERAVHGSHEDPDTRGRALRLLRSSYLTDPRVERLVVPLILSHDEATDGFVFEVIARHPDREVRILAYKALIRRAEDAIRRADLIRTDEGIRKDVEANEGSDYLARALDRGDRGKAEVEDYTKVARDLFGVERFPDLSIGAPAPAVAGRTLDGRDETLDDYRGKVVVLDIWATWCGPCVEMIPHQRALVARQAGRPFALISVSVDEEQETLTGFLGANAMPWTHWWNGAEGGIIDALDVTQYPTIFVLDAEGVIRAKDVRGEQLDAIVDELLAEAGAGAAD